MYVCMYVCVWYGNDRCMDICVWYGVRVIYGGGRLRLRLRSVYVYACMWMYVDGWDMGMYK